MWWVDGGVEGGESGDDDDDDDEGEKPRKAQRRRVRRKAKAKGRRMRMVVVVVVVGLWWWWWWPLISGRPFLLGVVHGAWWVAGYFPSLMFLGLGFW